MNNTLEKLEELIMIGDEQEARAFLIAHINDIPSEIRKKFIFALFMEAVENGAEVNDLQALAIEKGMAELKQAKKETQSIDDKIKLVDLKKKIQGIK